jgi:hypothetical protein
MKYLKYIFLFLFYFTSKAQWLNDDSDDPPQIQYAVQENGITQYQSVTPVAGSMDLNGAEMITATDDRTFETTKGNWGDNGNHSAVRSTVDKHAGSASLLVTSSAAGDGTTNFESLPSVNLGTIVSGNKYTVEAWCRGTGILGSDLISGYNFTSGWTLSNGGTINSSTQFTTITASDLEKTSTIFVKGNTYEITVAGTTNVSGGIAINDGYESFTDQLTGTFNSTVRYKIGTYYSAIPTNSNLYVTTAGSGVTTITTFTVKLITQPTVTLAIGSKTQSTASVSCIAGTFTKAVFNFQATASEVGQPLKIYFNQADVVYVDDVSLTQKRDMIILMSYSTAFTGGAVGNVRVFVFSAGGTERLKQYIGTGGRALTIQNGDNNAVSISPFMNLPADTKMHFLACVLNAAGNTVGCVDGTYGTAVDGTSLGKLTGLDLFKTTNTSGSTMLNGNIGAFQIILLNALPTDGGVAIITDAYNRFKSNRPFASSYPNQVSGGIWIDWKNGSMMDRFGIQGVLTNNGSAPIIPWRN